MRATIISILFMLILGGASLQAEEKKPFEIYGIRLGMTLTQVEEMAETMSLAEVQRNKAPSKEQVEAKRRGELVVPSAYKLVRKIKFKGNGDELEVQFNHKSDTPEVSLVQLVSDASKETATEDEAALIEQYGQPNARGYKSLIWGGTEPLPLRTQPSLEYRMDTVSSLSGKSDVSILVLRNALE